jgi:hypothetical protein
MNAAEARRRVRDALRDNTLRWSIHQRQRRNQRSVQAQDVREALANAGLPTRSETNPGEAWKFIGKAEDGTLTVVVGFDADDPTIVTVWWIQ